MNVKNLKKSKRYITFTTLSSSAVVTQFYRNIMEKNTTIYILNQESCTGSIFLNLILCP